MMHAHLSPDDCRDRLQAVGLKVTHQRVQVLQELSATPTHPTAEALFEQLAQANPSLSLATVYRVLGDLVEAGLAQRLNDQHGRRRFDANLAPHHHLICERTREIVDFEDAELINLIADYFRRKPILGFTIEAFQLNIQAERSTGVTALH
jgi:Fur family transcriptional regulator, peroxide stress response regulator